MAGSQDRQFREFIPGAASICTLCGRTWWYDDGKHYCPPKWLVWEKGESEDDATAVYAYDRKSAAEKWADAFDANGDYAIVYSGEDLEIQLRKLGDDEIHDATVTGEVVPSYHVTFKSKGDAA